MAEKVSEVMSKNPVTLEATTPIEEAARVMRDRDLGAVVVMNDSKLCGIVTDRDIVVRAVAQGRQATTPLKEICSQELATIRPDDSIEDAIRLMREKAVRRLPVTDDGRPLGIVSLGDLARVKDSRSVLADISGAPANH